MYIKITYTSIIFKEFDLGAILGYTNSSHKKAPLALLEPPDDWTICTYHYQQTCYTFLSSPPQSSSRWVTEIPKWWQFQEIPTVIYTCRCWSHIVCPKNITCFFSRVVIIFHLLAVEGSLHAWIAFYGKVNLSTGCKLFYACKYWLAQKMSKLFYANCWRLLTLQHCLLVYFLEKQDILC